MDILAELANRDKGQVPVSIGTSLALEGAAGILEEAPVTPAPLLSVNELWVNLRTLFRNLYGALTKELKGYVTPEHLVMTLQEELGMIRAAVAQIAGGKVTARFYYCGYDSVPRVFPKARLREPTTPLQLTFNGLEQTTLRELIGRSEEGEIRLFNIDIEGSNPKALMITHIPLDLLSFRHFRDLALLESHTGVVKTRHQWNTKLTNGNDLVRIPFNRMTLQLFGDGGTFFSPFPIKIRRAILEIAERRNWSVVTTKDKILYDVKMHRDPALEALIRSLF